jgi:hypothetical protein
MSRTRQPFHVQPIITGPLLGGQARTKAAAIAAAQRLCRRHRLAVAVWHDAKPGPGEAERVDLVRLVEPADRRRGRKAS